MKIIYTFLFTFLLAMTSCVDKYDSGKDNSMKQTHGYDVISDKLDLEISTQSRANPDRNNWQKPREVIRLLGDLKGKTVADIGAGYGYFSFQFLPSAGKVIAIDIDKNALAQVDSLGQSLREGLRQKLETRLVGFNSPELADEEVDIVFMSNTYAYIENKVEYLQTVFKGMKSKGRLYIVDFKMKRLPPLFPVAEEKIPLFEVEKHLEEAGFRHVFSDDRTLEFQYIVVAEK